MPLLIEVSPQKEILSRLQEVEITTNPKLCSIAMNKGSRRFLQKGGGISLQHENF